MALAAGTAGCAWLGPTGHERQQRRHRVVGGEPGTRKMAAQRVPVPPDGSRARSARGALLGMRLVGAPAG